MGNGAIEAQPRLFALLIGIDCYLPNLLSDGKTFRNLRGCVRDIHRVEQFLRQRMALDAPRIVKLTSTSNGSAIPTEQPQDLPSYDNIVAAFKKVTRLARRGDRVYVHYSGHGGRATTTRVDLKGSFGIDETLVPYDIGEPNGRYLRDFELAHILSTMVDKGLIVTAVLDSCHSGGMVRGTADVAVRGLETVDATPRPTPSSVASANRLATSWRKATANGTRDVAVGSGWLPEPEGYTLLAACRPSESAMEYAFDGAEREGVLTHWLLDALQDIHPRLSYKVVYDRLVARVHSQFSQQTPQLQGEGDRIVLGSARIAPVYAVTVLRAETARRRLLIAAGQAHNLRLGATFVVYPHGTTDFSDAAQRLATAEATEVGASTSWAAITKTLSTTPIEQGAQAVQVSATRLVRRVALVRQPGLPAGIDQDAALLAIRSALPDNGWIEPAAGNQDVAYQVTVNSAGEYEVWDAQGQPFPNLLPPLKTSDPLAAKALVRRLVHLAKYHALVQFANHDMLSPLAGALVVDLAGKRTEYDPMDPFVAQEQFTKTGGAPILRAGEWTALRIRNNATRPLNITVLNLRPGWAVRQVYPVNEGDDFVQFDAGQQIVIPLQARLPNGYAGGRDTLKVFATAGNEATSFRWLELPALDESMQRSPAVRDRAPGDPLEALLAAFTDDQPRTRDLVPAATPSHEWVTAQVEISIQAS